MNKNSLNEGYLPDNHGENVPENGTAENHGPVRYQNTLQSSEPGFKYGQTRRTSNPRPCRPPITPFDTETYVDIVLQLENLKNLETEELPKPGEFIVRVMCMGHAYGHFPSGNVNLHSLAIYARSEEPSNYTRSPDIFLEHEVELRIKFKSLVDNPVVLHLCHARGDLDNEQYASLPPLAYICLDLGRLLNYKLGTVTGHIEPWIIPEKIQNASKLPFFANGVTPLLQLSLQCYGGLPETSQLLQGNLMTVLCEGLHNLPAIVQQNVPYSDNQADMQVYMRLPHTQTESALRFPGGKYRETFLLEPTFRKVSQLDENTQTATSLTDMEAQDGGPSVNNLNSVPINQMPAREPRHWASVKENSPDTPLEATAMVFDTELDALDNGGEGDTEIFGDGREDFMEFSETGEPRIVWNSIHRKYLSVDGYRSMLSRLSQNAVWPIEISVAVKKKSASERSKKKKDNITSVGGSKMLLNTQPSVTSSTESNDRMLMSELGQQSAAATLDYTLIFHGVAFVDLSCLVHPGMKAARFSCRVYPFSNEMLQRKTCATESVLPEPLLLSLVPKTSTDNARTNTTNSRNQRTGAVINASSSNPKQTHKPSLTSNQIDSQNQVSQQDVQPKSRGSQNRRSDIDAVITGKGEQNAEMGAGIERNPFIVFRISMLRSIVPCYKTKEISKVVEEYLPKRELTRRKLVNASSAQQKYKKAILEAAAEISHEFSEHYWKDVLQNGHNEGAEQSSSNAASNETLKKGFIFYLNASGRYLIIREHLRGAVSHVVQQTCMNLRPSGFHNHRDFQSYLHDMYVYLVDEMNEILSSTTLQETDPLKSNMDRLLQQSNCAPEEELSKDSLHNRQITDLGIFAEESFAQGDFETCHKLHLQRICRDKESSRCWTEFAIMWLARGDDRMAEIAVREALRKDPLHLYALLISGMIAVRHGDERGLECLGAALGLLPMAPEILVIVGISNSVIGNDIAADYFFRKAAYVHRTITGQPSDEVEKLFAMNNAKKPFNMKQFAKEMDSAMSQLPETSKNSALFDGSTEVDAQQVLANGKRNGKRSKPRISLKEGATGGFKTIPEEDNQQPQKSSSKDKRRSTDFNNNLRKMSGNLNGTTITVQLAQDQSDPIELAPLPNSNGPRFSFLENLNDILPEEVVLHPLASSIQSPFNVTLFSEQLEKHLLTIDYLEKSPNGQKFKKQGEDSKRSKQTSDHNAHNIYIPKDDGIAPDAQIKEEYDKIVKDREESIRSGSVSRAETSGTVVRSSDALSSSSKSQRSGNKRSLDKGIKSDLLSKQSEVIPVPVSGSGADTATDLSNIPADGKPQVPKLTDRLGTELIWAAHLLVNLRLFDFVDGVLAKHLYFYGKRNVQFLYLRALSLYLRQREEEALPLIKEAIEYDNTNGVYYALEGHCYYILGSTLDAIASYEKALRIPHINENRHLLYLRYGSLVLDQGKSKVAKRVFLHGVSKYPTPYMWLALGSACFQRQEYDQAESSFAEANRLDSTNPIAWGHLALSSLMQDKKALAEQSYKWAVRFGLKKGILLEEIQRLQREKGFGDPSFPRIPNCVPHDYYLRRLGRRMPFNLYKEGLNQNPPRMGRDRYEDTEHEVMLKNKLNMMAKADKPDIVVGNEEWGGEDYEGLEGTAEETMTFRKESPFASHSTGFAVPSSNIQSVQSAPPDMVTSVKTIKPATARNSVV